MSDPTKRWVEARGEKPVNEMRVRLYERLMEAQEQIAHARYGQGIKHEAVLAALDAAETELSDDERREDLYLSSLSAYVRALGGRLEIRAVFADSTVLVQRALPLTPRRGT